MGEFTVQRSLTREATEFLDLVDEERRLVLRLNEVRERLNYLHKKRLKKQKRKTAAFDGQRKC